MDISCSIKLPHNFEAIKSDRLFYDQFQYCVKFNLNGISCLRGMPTESNARHAYITASVRHRFEWGQRVKNYAGNWNPRKIDIHDPAELIQFSDVIVDHLVTSKLVISSNWGYVYTNDLALVQTLSEHPGLRHHRYTCAEIARDRNTIHLKESDYAYRSYLKERRLTSGEQEYLRGFLNNLKDVRLSPGLLEWNKNPLRYTMRHFFVDHKNPHDLSFVNLVCPGLIRSTLSIICTK
jgi:hypothetical protein